jgi:hypothetical protein
MADTALALALRRLEGAIGSIEATAARIIESDRTGSQREAEISHLTEDRLRMAEELDGLNARAARLDATNRDVGRRLDGAIESIRTIIGRHGGAN